MKLSSSKLLWLAILIGLAVRLAAVFFFIGDRFVWPDEAADYYSQAMKMYAGEGWGDKTKITPVFPFLMSGLFFFSKASILTTRILLSLLNTGLILAVYSLAKSIFNPKAAVSAAFIFAVYPIAVYSAGLMVPEAFFSLLICVGLICFLKGEENPRYFYAAALFFGLAEMTISITLPFFVLSAALLFFFSRQADGFFKKTSRVTVYILLFSLFSVLWGARNQAVLGEFIVVKNNFGEVLYLHNNPYASGFSRKSNYEHFEKHIVPALQPELEGKHIREQDKIFLAKAIEFIRANKMRFLALCGERFLNLWRFYPDSISQNEFVSGSYKYLSVFTFAPVLILFMTGLLLGLKGWRGQLPLYAFILSLTLIFCITRTSLRARLPLEPLIVIYAAAGLEYLVTRTRKKGLS